MSRAGLWLLAVTFLGSGCELDAVDVGSNQDDKPSFEEFEAGTYKEPGADGVYIVNGDTPVENIKKLREFYEMLYSDGGLIVHTSGGQDAKWNNTQKLNLTYCVSDSFGSRKATMVAAMNKATTEGWELAANVNFVHVTSQDGNCTASNGNVVFDVRPISNQPYLARAFFPNNSRSARNVLVDTSAFNTGWPLSGIIAHELGHALGFRHEHTRPEAGQCYEDNNWRPLTGYDSASVMHYPQCGGSGQALTISQRDKDGASALYGAPNGGGTPDPEPDPTPDPEPEPEPTPGTGTPRTGSASGNLSRNQQHSYQGLSVVPGTLFDARISGSGDADLYVRFNNAPTTSQYDCRPYLNGSSERCQLDVPNGATAAYIMVRGYTAASYTLTVNWVSP